MPREKHPSIHGVAPATPPQPKGSRIAQDDGTPPRTERPPLADPSKSVRSRGEGLSASSRRRSSGSRPETQLPQLDAGTGVQTPITAQPRLRAEAPPVIPLSSVVPTHARCSIAEFHVSFPEFKMQQIGLKSPDILFHFHLFCRSDKSGGKAPRPAGKNGFSSSEWFSSAGVDDDLFHWSLRPETQKVPRNVPPAQASSSRGKHLA